MWEKGSQKSCVGGDERMAWGLLSSGPHIAKGWSRVPQLQDAKINAFNWKAVRMGLRPSRLPVRGPKCIVPGEAGTINQPPYPGDWSPRRFRNCHVVYTGDTALCGPTWAETTCATPCGD